MNIVEANRLKDFANKIFNNGEVAKSIEIYSRAINIQGLPNDLFAVLYSNRAAAYLRAASDRLKPSKDWEQLALDDAKESLNLRPTWFKAHYRVGCSYVAMEKYQESLPYFDKAIELDPGNLDLKTIRDDNRLKSKMNVTTYRPYWDPGSLDEFNASRGSQISWEQLNKNVKRLRKQGDPIADVFDAENYKDGRYGVKQNYKKAVEFYTKAANKGDAQGIFELAFLIEEGKGTKQDFERAIKLFKKAAEMSPFMNENNQNIPIYGVAESEFHLGSMYSNGVGVQADHFEAAKWFKRSSDHGCVEASFNLALMYKDGEGVERSLERSVQYWKLAASRKCYRSMRALAEHYLHNERDIIEAKMWHKRAVEYGRAIDKPMAENFEKELEKIENDDEDIIKKVKRWEEDNGFPVRNLTFRERVLRMLKVTDPLGKTYYDVFTVYRTPYKSFDSSKFDLRIIHACALEGSKTALRLENAFKHFMKALSLMEHHLMSNRTEAINIVQELANCIRIEHIVAKWTEKLKVQAVEIVNDLLSSELSSDVERDARVCYAYLHLSSFQETRGFLMESINKFPSETLFYLLYGNVLCYLEEYEDVVQESNKALELFPKNVELLFNKVKGISRLEHHNLSDAVQACEDLLESADYDHQYVPECYYTISALYLKHQGLEQDAIKNYLIGLEAEETQLPFFSPYDSDIKFGLKVVIQCTLKSSGNLPKAGLPKAEIIRLADPRRIEIITSYRLAVLRMKTGIKEPLINIGVPKLKQTAPTNTAGLKAITLRDLDPNKTKIYNGCYMKVICIEDAIHPVSIPSKAVVIEDKNGDVQRLLVNSRDEEIRNKLVFGCRVSVINPYLEIALDGKPTLRVDDEKSLFFHVSEIELKRCRF